MPPLSSIPSICINLQRRPDRLKHFREQIHGICPFILLPAIDGQKLHLYQEDAYLSDFLQIVKGTEKVLGEIGCSLSHFLAIKTFIHSNLESDFIIIFEDDILLNSQHTIQRLQMELSAIPFEWDVVYIGGQWTPNYTIDSQCHLQEHKIRNEDIGDRFSVVTDHLFERTQNSCCVWNSPYFRTAGAYVLNMKSAQKIYDIICTHKSWFISTPWDMFLLSLQKNDFIRTLDYLPHLFYQGGFNITNTDCLLNNDIHRESRSVIRMNESSVFDKFIFVPKKDVIDNDMYRCKVTSMEDILKKALQDDQCVAVNSLGYFKSKLDGMVASPYFKSTDGIYVKKQSTKDIENTFQEC